MLWISVCVCVYIRIPSFQFIDLIVNQFNLISRYLILISHYFGELNWSNQDFQIELLVKLIEFRLLIWFKGKGFAHTPKPMKWLKQFNNSQFNLVLQLDTIILLQKYICFRNLISVVRLPQMFVITIIYKLILQRLLGHVIKRNNLWKAK